jgi:hypothetical protein
VQAILTIQLPTGVKQLQHFFGMVQYYHDLWVRRSKMHAPVHQRTFNHLKATVAKDVVLAYPDYSNVFKIYADFCRKQLGAVITQDNKPTVFFSWNLSNAQHK